MQVGINKKVLRLNSFLFTKRSLRFRVVFLKQLYRLLQRLVFQLTSDLQSLF